MPEKKTKQNAGKIPVNLGKILNSGPMLNSTGSFLSGGSLFNPDNIGIKNYESMIENDETCSSGVEFITLATLSRLGRYIHQDKHIMDFINNQFERVRGSLFWIVEEMLTALWAGFSTGEIILKIEEADILLEDVQFLHPATVSFSLNQTGPAKNTVKNIVQQSNAFTPEGVEIPAEKALIYTHRGKFGNPYGQSRFRMIYPVYYFKKQLMSFWARTLERYGSPTAVGTVSSPQDKITDEYGNEMNKLELMARILQNLQNSTGIAISDDSKIDFLQVNRALGNDFETAVNYCNKMIYRGLLIPTLVGDHGSSGSYSLGKIHFDLFVLSLEKLKTDITETLLDQLIRKLIVWNFGEQKEWGEFQTSEFKTEETKLFASIFESMTNSGYISPDDYQDMLFVRQKLGIPGINTEDWLKRKEGKKETGKQKKMEQYIKDLDSFIIG